MKNKKVDIQISPIWTVLIFFMLLSTCGEPDIIDGVVHQLMKEDSCATE